MKKTELIQLLTQIKLGYPNFLWNEAVEAFWYKHLQSVPIERAQRNLDEYIITSSFEPKIADIVKRDPNAHVDYEQQRIESRERFEHYKLLENKPALTPEEIEQIKREVEAGLHDDAYPDDPYLGRRKR